MLYAQVPCGVVVDAGDDFDEFITNLTNAGIMQTPLPAPPNTFTSANFTIDGTLKLTNTDNLFFNDCEIGFTLGSGIQMTGTSKLELYGAVLFPCESNWEGIDVNGQALLMCEPRTTIIGAKTAIHVTDFGLLQATQSIFLNNETCIYLENNCRDLVPDPINSDNSFFIKQCLFENETNSKENYGIRIEGDNINCLEDKELTIQIGVEETGGTISFANTFKNVYHPITINFHEDISKNRTVNIINNQFDNEDILSNSEYAIDAFASNNENRTLILNIGKKENSNTSNLFRNQYGGINAQQVRQLNVYDNNFENIMTSGVLIERMQKPINSFIYPSAEIKNNSFLKVSNQFEESIFATIDIRNCVLTSFLVDNNTIEFYRNGISLDLHYVGENNGGNQNCVVLLSSNNITFKTTDYTSLNLNSPLYGIKCKGNSSNSYILFKNTILFLEDADESIKLVPSSYGIYIADNGSNSSIGDFENGYNVITFDTKKHIGTGINIKNNKFESNNNTYIKYNKINGASMRGISLLGVVNPEVICNEIKLEVSNNTNLTDGIYLSSTTNARISGNVIEGPIDMTQFSKTDLSFRGLFASFCNSIPEYGITCNRFTNIGNGMKFNGVNLWTALKGNDFTNTGYGLILDTYCQLGLQGNITFASPSIVPKPVIIRLSNDNVWDPDANTNSQRLHIWSDNWTMGVYNQFFIRDIGGGMNNIYNPTTNEANDPAIPAMITLINPMFTPFDVKCTNFSCSDGDQPPGISNPGEDNNPNLQQFYLETKIKNYEIFAQQQDTSSQEGGSEAYYMSMQSLYSALQEDPELTSNSTLLLNTRDSLSNTNIAKIYQVDSLIQSGDTLGAISLNSTIVPDNILESNHKTYNQHYLHFLTELSDSLSNNRPPPCMTELCANALKLIAEQCVFTGGRAVLHARALLAISDTVDHFFPEDDCLGSSSPKEFFNEEKEHQNFTFYPNPVKDQLNINYQLSSSDQAQLEVFDLKGTKVYQQKLDSRDENVSISVQKWTKGLYIVKIFLDNNTYVTKKILVTE